MPSNSFPNRRRTDGESGGTSVQDPRRDGRAPVRLRAGRSPAVRRQVVPRKRGVLPVCAQVGPSEDVLRGGRD